MSIVCNDLSFTLPDGTPVLDRIDLTIGPGRTGLIGVNGAGKSTLLRLVAGQLRPTRGSVSVAGEVGYLPQNLPLDTARRVDEMLGIAHVRHALRAIEEGDASDRHFATIGDDWDVEERARKLLDRLGLGHVELDRAVGALSGGEAVLVALSALLLRRPDVLLLDEPTNNLDLDARGRLYAAVSAWTGVLVVVSHDRALLDRVDQIVELSDGTARSYGGNLTAYEQAVASEQEAAERAVRVAEADVRRQRRELTEAQTKLDRRARAGRKAAPGLPRIVANARKRAAQVSAGKLRDLHADRLAAAQARLEEAVEAVRDDDEIRVDLPETAVPAGRTVLTVEGVANGIDLMIRGPERVALLGPNGAGKTTLLRQIVGELSPAGGTVRVGVPVRYLPQRLDILDDTVSVLENARRLAPAGSLGAVRLRLARFLFRGDRADQLAGTLSGGERFRAALAAVLSAQPPPQLLLLDEPTNNLDMASVRQLEQALAGYRGALIVASHDLPFLSAIGITRWLRLDRTSGLREAESQLSG
ncbi:MAG: ABC-F family ATP-binding cassette domain-containing protein [Micromonosporaceae bacterium]|jgi:ATPase subunit of ABC transporter with duplicated ATPase domains|nr:ABC-F family ATP-binding cassette domain-containing protein [Micromonosporaceae bacterium]